MSDQFPHGFWAPGLMHLVERETPHRCPVCNGTGNTHVSPIMPYGYGISDGTGSYACQSCGGSGVLWRKP